MVVVHAQGGDAAVCGVAFQEGERYLVYAYRSAQGEGDRLETGACDSTQSLSTAAINLEVLGPPLAGLPEAGGAVAPAAVARGGTVLLLLASLTVGELCLHERWGRDLR